MNKLIEKDDCGNWSLKGVRWSNLMPGALITKDTYEKVYAVLCKLMDYEDTDHTPTTIRDIERFAKRSHKRAMEYAIQLDEMPRWIPVSERLPEDGTYLCTLDGELCGIDEPFTGMCGIENGKWYEEGCVIAWMELPEPYRSEEHA